MTAKKKPVKRVKAGTSKASAADKRAAFVEAYFANGGNASQAAVTAGYSAPTCGVTGAKMLKDPRVAAEISKRRTEVCANLGLNTERTLRELGRLAFSDPRNIMHSDGRIKMPHELDADTAAAIASFEVSFDGSIKYKFWDKNSALEKAAKVQGLYEKDNKQRNPLEELSREVLQGIRERLIGIKR
jgi:phage terminase small subunit